MLASVAAASALSLTAGSGIAGAAAGGSDVGSVGAPVAPKLRDSICLTNCVGLRKAVPGSTIQVSGTDMAAADAISFRSRGGKRRLLSDVTAATPTSAQTVVPKGVRTGKLRVLDAYGQKSETGKEPIVIRPKKTLRATGPLNLVDAQVSPNKVLFGSRSAILSYVVRSGQPSNDLRVDVVTPAGQVVQSFLPTGVPPNTTQSLTWNGTGLDGRGVANGWYSFRISSVEGQALSRSARAKRQNLGVAVYSYIFPVRGQHDFGSSGAGFGAGRAGHTHQGQDVMSPCGTKLVAARGGTVQYSGYQGSAGNYLIIDLKGSAEDHGYMHLAAPSPLPVGSKVRTGQYVGNVGDTGNAQGCHLHFEIWGAPGWYEGGQPYDPLPSLLLWDKYS